MAGEIKYGTTGKPHPYHIVRPSIWPLVASFAAGLLALGAILFMHEVKVSGFNIGLKGLVVGLIGVLLVMFFWWKDVIYEAVTEKIHSDMAMIGMRYGMALFIASEVMFFVAFFWAFFDASLYAGDIKMPLRLDFTQGIWPPPEVYIVNPMDLPFLMTMILLLSGCTATWAHHAILENDQKNMVKALGITVLLGVFFMVIQTYEYVYLAHKGMGLGSEGIYTSTFFMATGFHGFHVFIGTIFLAVCYFRARKKHFTAERHFGFEAAAWYWHFVDVVWLFLFVAIYLWGNTIGVGPAQ